MKTNSLFQKAIALTFLSVSFSVVNAQKVPYAPNQLQVVNAYKKASDLDSTLRNIPTNNEIIPFWKKDGSAFWYKKNLPNKNWEYIYVDLLSGQRKPAFDAVKLAESIEKTTGKKQSSARLQLSDLYFIDQNNIKVKVSNKWYGVNLNDYGLINATDTATFKYNAKRPLQQKRSRWEWNRSISKSPDGKNEIQIVGGNIVVKNLDSKVETTLSTDGSVEKPYGNFEWSPDGKNIIAYKIDPKETKKVYYVLSSVPGTTRGELKSREYAQPGDDFTTYQPYIFNVATKTVIKVDVEPTDFFGPQPLHWRNNSSRYYTYEKADRGHQRFRVIEVDVQTGKIRNVIDEKTKTFIYESRIYTRYLPKTNEILWSSEQDGWQHLYLVNEITKKQQLITRGNYVVRDIDSVDVVKRQVWFKASGMNPGEDPYFIHYYRIGFDGKGLINLTPEIGNHALTFSPDRKYYLDTYSQVNVAPITKLKLTASTKALQEIEHGDVQVFLNTGVKLPEVFVAKGRDGKTDIWGLVCLPSKIDSSKSYPVIEYIYAGPQDSFVPKNFLPFSEMQSMAELGFIVVQMDGMGTANRSKAFHDVCWQNLADAGFADRILWMKAMAAKYQNADLDKVGIYGTSAGGQNSTGALLFHPEFYKAAVSACGCHDNRIDKQWWNEQWMGYPVGPHYGEQSNITNAAKLQGNLFLIVGEADENVPPESTYRLADALIKANKDFDILSIPGMGHSDGGIYGRRRKRDFFVKHLLNAEPPNVNSVTQVK
ncbi:prolyl oligopeptidase family serine peptidase [Pedobacter sp. MC2016-05]|uniref:S9 family peptidase n=1 Tax=Pedobacter sp. MC2016-05 TaxID=2994474 RepID=UPI0022467B4E|nr:S9 family peptidase [Pedobacter sp. MC2016-05]MCX2476277.1 prolyl oligopeptidase family serine peptidase [Pedobacter sp. MC2016-05]